ncbi:hypothetical protein [Bacillus pseudomycoides]|uniref:hypothetical protein n=1 Tax=Bacillus pseudomycoides TaxID=64104 RepID=UPI000BEF288A|nr:hypothetical protein [Bacillus pseudomycoides]PEI40639.1 hypothetical protein CN641_24605 [Bacillus pseudomycoides]PGA65268.1 hypothetical protein COL87_28130 [Bacillus pseudomycoides]PGE94276.1 hypothetical protein COM62_24915 [Bacillus pseudomycoides]PHB18203.1 hypothetical protein COE80_25780 [Bacillus pseudomycoides]PHE18538.1 hypothetical protein COF59_08590 [Bacillus pseudomycoides]
MRIQRRGVYFPLAEKTGYPSILFVIIIIFWIPALLISAFMTMRHRVKVHEQKREIDVMLLRQDLEKDNRFLFINSITGELYVQTKSACISCEGYSDLVDKIEKFGEKDNPSLQLKLKICTHCMAEGKAGLDVLGEEYGRERRIDGIRV